MKAGLYVRVSTDIQAEEGFSISAQINELSKYCKKEEIEIYKIYSDEGISGTLEARPQFQAMLHDAEKKLFDMILVHKYDRFARNVELSQKVKKQLKKTGIALISITEPLEDSPMGFFVGGLHELMAEYYSRNLGKESKKGHIERASQGFHNGSVPYGYKIDHNHASLMAINEDQAKTVRLIFDLYVNKGYGCAKISNYLNDNGIISAVGKEWRYYTVNRLLKNIKYAGYIYYDNKIYEGKHEPIISKEIFDIVQSEIVNRTWVRAKRGANFEKFAFLGILKCGYCGCAVCAVRNTRNHYSYMCNSSRHFDKVDKCKYGKAHRISIIEEKILSYIEQIASKVEYVEGKELINNADFIIDRKNKLEQKILRLKEGYLNGIFTIEEYKEKEILLIKELEDIKIEPERKKIPIRVLWNKLGEANTPSEKRSILKLFINHIEIYDDGDFTIVMQ